MEHKWIQLPPLRCQNCNEAHISFEVFARADGFIGISTKCSCGAQVEASLTWEGVLEFAENAEDGKLSAQDKRLKIKEARTEKRKGNGGKKR